MDINRLTRKSQEALTASQAIASEYNHQQVDCEHLLCAMLRDSEGLIPQILRKMNIDTREILKATEDELSKLPRVTFSGTEQGKIYITQRLERLFTRQG